MSSILKNYKKKTRQKVKVGLTLTPFIAAIVLTALLILVANFSNIAFSRRSLVLGAANSAYENLLAAQDHLSQADLEQAADLFLRSSRDFQQVNNTLGQLVNGLQPLSENQIESAKLLAEAGQSISSAGYFLSSGLQKLSNTAPAFSSIITLNTSRGGAIKTSGPESVNVRKILEDSYGQITWASELLTKADADLKNVDINVLPPNIAPSFNDVKDKVQAMRGGLRVLSDFNRLLLDLFSGYHKTYLLIFQNTAETRPTGGFLGSYGLLKIKNGSIVSLLIESTYEIDGRLAKIIEPPQPFKNAGIERWYLRDANWWPDFSVSAENISRFYEWEGRETVDGIIAFTPQLMEEMVSVLGEIEMPTYGVVVNTENFYETVQYYTSIRGARDIDNPKEFMADLTTAIFERIPNLDTEKKLRILGSLIDNIDKKNFLVWSRHNDTQNLIRSMRLAGELADIKSLNSDYLLISNANIGGSKTDRYMVQEVMLKTILNVDGSAVNRLEITKINQSPGNLENTVNKHYTRLYVPLGSKLIHSSEPVEAFEELGRTVFSYRSSLDSGQSHNLVLEYRLPAWLYQANSHTLYIEKNPGQILNRFTYEFVIPEGRKIVRNINRLTEEISIAQNTQRATIEHLDKDLFWAIVFE